MKKLVYFLSIGVLASTVLFSNCKNNEEIDATACENQMFPGATGSATVSIKSYTVVGDFTVLDVSAGDNLSFAVEITKGTDRPQKLRIYQTNCINKMGDLILLAGQPDAEEGDTRFDLRDTDDAQIKEFLYTVPTGMTTVFLNLEIEESGGKYTYKKIRLNVLDKDIINNWSGITLGAQENTAASRMSSGTGLLYADCNAAVNMEYIDITYGWNNTGYFLSNPERFQPSPLGLTDSPPNCGDDGSLPTNGGTATYFKIYSGSDFSTITDSLLSTLTVSLSDPQFIAFDSTGGVYEFLNSRNKKGLIKVTGYTDALNGSATIDVKVQR